MTTGGVPAPRAPVPKAGLPRIAIQDASSWILRVGVVSSVAVMLSGLAASFLRGGNSLSVQQMESSAFSLDLHALATGLAQLNSFALMELGVLMLVATPILRVLAAMFLFAVEERDRLYALVTFIVLVVTLGSLLFVT